MCGIFGIVSQEINAQDDIRLRESARLINHRGPDNTGIFTDEGIGLVHTRLSLLDLSSKGNQPFWDKTERYCLVYNGEIYNFKELRSTLEMKGIHFTTATDTEVLLELLVNFGLEDTLLRLEGMFAFALYDKVDKTLKLARDRFGIKPLFIYDEDDAFIFASEPNAMRPWIAFEPDNLSITSFLLGFGGPSKGYTFLKKIKSLPPGTVAEVRLGQLARYKEFFSVVDFWERSQTEELKRFRPQRLIDKVDELLFASVEKQLFANAPVGALCSGGIDSSLIMAMASKIHNNLAIFHANVVGESSEFKTAARLAKHLGLELKSVEVHKQDFIDLLPEVIEHFGHPFCIIPSSIPFLMVSKLVRLNNVKAVLTGEGSDECFLGYKYLAPDISIWWKQTNFALTKLTKTLIKRLIGRHTASPPKFTMGFSPHYGMHSNSSMNLAELIMGLHNRFEVALETQDILNRLDKAQRRPFRNYMESLDLLNYNLRVLLHRNDTMGMAASIESRFPFLDTALVKLAVNIPHNCKIRFSPVGSNKDHYFFTEKWILRKVADRYLPKELSRLHKKTFNDNSYGRLRIASGFFEKSFIAEFFGLSIPEVRYLVDNASHSLKLKLLHLDIWANLYINNSSRHAIDDRLHTHLSFLPLK
jgi:asparagine synthase (glutamine-hydrolysing)